MAEGTQRGIRHTGAVNGQDDDPSCSACDFDTVSSLALSRAGKRGPMREKVIGSLNRIARQLATRAGGVDGEREHLEEGALLFYATLTARDHWLGATRVQQWLEAERARKAGK